MQATAKLILSVGLSVASPVMAQEVGQYQVVPLPHLQGEGHYALILDTKNGHLWEWEQLPNSQGMIVYGVRCQGQMTPGQSLAPNYPLPQRR